MANFLYAMPSNHTLVENMPYYLVQGTYAAEGSAALLANPENRIEAVKSAVERLGGELHGGWFSFGEYDIVFVVNMPDSVSAVAASLAFSAGGAVKVVKTTPLITAEEAVEAMKKATEAGYRPPQRHVPSKGVS
jgi:uncharacterized protein with GYD domain